VSFKLIVVIAIGFGVGMAGGLAIVLHDRWRFGATMLRKILIAVPFALIALAVISVPIILQKTMGESAEAHVARFGYHDFKIRGTRMPCAALFDVGFLVRYQTADRQPEDLGRVCRGLSGGWTWYPSTNTMVAADPP
jgi:hypothetical protein